MKGRRHGLTLNQRNTKTNMLSADISEELGSQLKFLCLWEYDTVSLNHVPSADTVKNRNHDAKQRKAIMTQGNDNLTSL